MNCLKIKKAPSKEGNCISVFQLSASEKNLKKKNLIAAADSTSQP
jgi:hypothetical protein